MKKTILQLSIAFTLFLLGGKAQAQVDGNLDTSFDIGTGFNVTVMTITLQPDGKILVGGFFTKYNEETQPAKNSIVRLNTDGTLDTSFTIIGSTGITGNQSPNISTIAVQPDGKILIGGGFTHYNNLQRNKIARLNEDGSLDTSFYSYFSSFVKRIVLQPDGKILVGGGSSKGISRLNENGSTDTSFNAGATGFGGYIINEIFLQPDGKVLVVGEFSHYNNIQRNGIARLNTDGTLDTSFNPGTLIGGGNINTVALQTDGKILVGGSFNGYYTQGYNGIVRLNTDGSFDTSFDIGTGFFEGPGTGFNVNTIVLQPDGKILVGGDFIVYNGQTQNRIVRLNEDGSFDNSFNIGTGLDNWVTTIALQPNGKILVGGNFTEYDGITQNRIVRLNGTATAGIEDLDNTDIKIFPNPVKDILYFEKEIQKVTITDLTGKVLSTQSNSNQIDMSTFQNGVYLITIEQDNGVKETSKIIKQ